jgi:HlyD family secretion protein
MQRWLIRIGSLAALAVLVWLFRVTLLAPEPVPIRVHHVRRGSVEETVTNSRAGTVKARLRARLSPEYGGNTIGIPFREGDRVRAGEVVLRLDDSLQQARFHLARQDLEATAAQRHQACLSADRAERERRRMLRLADEEIVSTDLLDEVQSAAEASAAACDAARAGVAKAEAAVALAEVEIAKTVLRAPFDGVVAELSIEVGEWTTPSPPALPVPPVIDILDPQSVYITAPMDEVDSARVAHGQPVRVTVDSHRGQSMPGTVTRVAVYVLDLEAQNRTVEIEVDLEDAEFASALLPGTSADVEVILQVREDVTRIPTSALYEGKKVLVVVEDRLVERDVEVGVRNWNFTEIRAGIEAGELVVTSLDRPEIRPGAWVEIVEQEDADGSGET